MTDQRIALVTGAAQGLGRAIAERLAREGCAVVIADRHHEEARRTAAEMNAKGHEALALALDVGDEEAVSRAYAEIESRFARLDILVNSAGISGERAPLASLSLQGFEAVIRAKLGSSFLMSRGAIPLMKRRRWGRIVNLSSLSARGQPGLQRGGDAAAMAGIIGLSRVLAAEVGRAGITVNCVAPSPIRTALTMESAGADPADGERGAAGSVLGRLGEAADVAHGVAWLCSERASFITGIVLDINGGTVMR